MNKCKCIHNNTKNKKHMQGNENNDTNMFMKRANKHNRLSCLISTSISFHSLCLVIIKICGYVVYKFVKCYKFVISLLKVCHKVCHKVCIVKLKQTPHPTETILDLVLLVG